MKKLLCLLIGCFALVDCIPSRPRNFVTSFSEQRDTETIELESTRNSNYCKNDQFLVQYEGFTVSYNEDTLIPNWVEYELTAVETDGQYLRKGHSFSKDPSLKLKQADDSDYKNSGWSRGHMAPAADFKWSEKAMSNTFYFTNCCPQDQSLNAGQWNTLEEKVRKWAKKFGSITVITGPVIGKNINGTIGANRVIVPDAFFKAILAGNQAIAFVMYNHNHNVNLQKCAMSVDDLEKMIGFDLFSDLDDDFENRIESSYSLSFWNL